MLDLKKFSETKEYIVPIVGNWGKINGRLFVYSGEDGWYKIKAGDIVSVERKATQLEVDKTLKPLKKSLVYALGTEGIPLNFDTFKRKGLGEAEPVWGLDLPIFSVASVVHWEDGRLYFYEQTQSGTNDALRGAREAFEGRKTLLGVRGITPELRYYVLLADLQRQSYDALAILSDDSKWSISSDERKKRIKAFTAEFSVRLRHAIEGAGGTYVSHSKRGDKFLVEWKVGNQTVKSEIRDDLRIVSAGFCLSGDDEKHSMNSIIQLAKMFKKRAPLYITRE